MSPTEKTQATGADFEVSSQDMEQQHRGGTTTKAVENAQVALSVLSFLIGLVVLGTSSNIVSVYNSTHLPNEFGLPLWPDEFDLRPTSALVAGGVLVVLTKAAALIFNRVPALRSKRTAHSLIALATPSISFISVFVAVTLFYSINASVMTDTLQSWSCQWDFAAMNAQPYFGPLCRETKTALYLSIILIPVELVTLAIVVYQAILEKKATNSERVSKSNSPSLA